VNILREYYLFLEAEILDHGDDISGQKSLVEKGKDIPNL
jgi:Ca2+-binding EF-hand superfamily protein